MDAVQRTGVFFQMGFMRRFDPGYADAKRKIEAGAIGIAVISAVMGAPDPAEAAHALRARVEAARSRGGTGTRPGEA